MLINKASLEGLFVSLKATFNKAFTTTSSTWQKIAMKVPSTTGQEDYAWLANFPKMRKWIGEKMIKALEGFKYSVVNDDWEATVEVDRNHVEDDQLGIYAPQAQMAGWSAAQLPDEIVYDLVNNGFTNKCYDNKAFFATDHKVGKTTVANKGTAVLSAASLAAAKAGFGAARAAMKKFADEEGRPLNINPRVLLVPPALADEARLLMTADKLGEDPNPYKGTAEVIEEARLTSDTAWFLLDISKPVKPFIYQERKAPVFVSQTNPEADDVFTRKKFKFGAEARASGGYGFWQLAWGSTGAGG